MSVALLWLLCLLLLPLIVGSALCSCAETTLFGLTGSDREWLARERPVLSRRVERLLAEPRALLLTVLLGNMTVNTLYFVVSSGIAMQLEHGVWAELAIAVVTLLLLVLVGETLPKLVGNIARRALLPWVAPPVSLLHSATAPIRHVLEGPVLALRQFLGKTETHKVGRQHQVDQRYLERIEVLNFTIAHDDGQSLDSIDEAEVILTGASRTSKTPTCVYLAIRGVKAANVPLVPGMPPPPQLLAAKKPLIVGLWVSPDRLVQVRRNRLSTMGETRDTDYIEPDAVRAEIAATKQLFENNDWPTIDVSRRSIEETAAAVMNLLTERKEAAG